MLALHDVVNCFLLLFLCAAPYFKNVTSLFSFTLSTMSAWMISVNSSAATYMRHVWGYYRYLLKWSGTICYNILHSSDDCVWPIIILWRLQKSKKSHIYVNTVKVFNSIYIYIYKHWSFHAITYSCSYFWLQLYRRNVVHVKLTKTRRKRHVLLQCSNSLLSVSVALRCRWATAKASERNPCCFPETDCMIMGTVFLRASSSSWFLHIAYPFLVLHIVQYSTFTQITTRCSLFIYIFWFLWNVASEDENLNYLIETVSLNELKFLRKSKHFVKHFQIPSPVAKNRKRNSTSLPNSIFGAYENEISHLLSLILAFS